MNKLEFHDFMRSQLNEIQKFVNKHKKDKNAVQKWIVKYAKKFRKKWEHKMLKEKLSEYHSVIIEVKKTEKIIQDFFNLLSVRDNPKFDRCADYGERLIEIVLPFDEINISQLNEENTKKIIEVIQNYRNLRQIQKKLENEVNELNSIKNNIKQNMEFFNGNI